MLLISCENDGTLKPYQSQKQSEVSPMIETSPWHLQYTIPTDRGRFAGVMQNRDSFHIFLLLTASFR